jgi:hypothetical protein
MKSMKFFVLFLIFSAICLININLLAVNSGVDSVYNVLKGTWYKVFTYSGLTGSRDSVFNSDSTVIVRIAETDSISWKEYQNGILKNAHKYQISYSKSLVYQSNRWMLINGDVRIIVSFESFGFSYILDAYDGGGAGYSHSNFISGIIEPNDKNYSLCISPNPIHNWFSITGISKIESVEIHDMSGKLLKALTNYVTGQLVDISNMQAGMYIVTVNYSFKSSAIVDKLKENVLIVLDPE